MLTLLQVQSGGSFDIDYIVKDPRDRVILEGEKERQGDFVFTAQESGEYMACFDNSVSTFTEKMVDFEIAVSSSPSSPWNALHRGCTPKPPVGTCLLTLHQSPNTS